MWIGSLEASGPVPLLSRNDLAYFDWALSRANADALFEIYRPKPSVSPAQLAMLDAELQPEFAEYLEESLTPFLEKDAKISPGFLYEMGEGDALKFVYAGLGYDGNTRAIFQFRLSLGAKGWSEERATLISAPTTPRFSPRPQQMVPGDRVDYLPRDPATRQRLEAHNARYCRFEAIIARVVEK